MFLKLIPEEDMAGRGHKRAGIGYSFIEDEIIEAIGKKEDGEEFIISKENENDWIMSSPRNFYDSEVKSKLLLIDDSLRPFLPKRQGRYISGIRCKDGGPTYGKGKTTCYKCGEEIWVSDAYKKENVIVPLINGGVCYACDKKVTNELGEGNPDGYTPIIVIVKNNRRLDVESRLRMTNYSHMYRISYSLVLIFEGYKITTEDKIIFYCNIKDPSKMVIEIIKEKKEKIVENFGEKNMGEKKIGEDMKGQLQEVKQTVIVQELENLIAPVVTLCIENKRKITEFTTNVETREYAITSLQDKIDSLKNEIEKIKLECETEKIKLDEEKRRLNITQEEEEKNEKDLIDKIKGYIHSQAEAAEK